MTPQEVIESNFTKAMPIPHNAWVWSKIQKCWIDWNGQPIYS